MQAQQPKPAKPTVGQIMAAKRAKKREQEIERLAKAKIGNKSTDRFLIPFENYTGISLIDYTKFRNDLIKIQKMH